MANYSTKQVAKILGISRVTLQRWLLSRSVQEPERVTAGGVDARVWTESDIERVRQYKKTHYRKGRGRKRVKK